MSTDRWMDEEMVVYTRDGILPSYKEDHIWVSSNEVDETRAYFTEWDKSERERQIPYINAYIWNLDGEESGNPFQYSCLENPMDRGVWWATLHRVSKSQTRLKRQHTWNLEDGTDKSYLQSSRGDADIKNGLMVTVWEWEGGMVWESCIETYALPYVK